MHDHGSAPDNRMDQLRRTALLMSPLLLLYVAASRVASLAGQGDEPVYLQFAHNLTHGFYAQEASSDPARYLWHGPGLPLALAPAVAAGLSTGVMRLLAGPLLLFLA